MHLTISENKQRCEVQANARKVRALGPGYHGVQFDLLLCNIQDALAEAVSGVYSGWASIGASPEVYMTAMSIGQHATIPIIE